MTTPLITAPSGKSGVLEIDTSGDLVLNVGSVDCTQSVTFTDGTGVLTIGTLGGFAATITGFNVGDQIILPGVTVASDSFNASTHVLMLFDASSTQVGTLQFGAGITNGSTLSVNGVTPCFVAGTRISTERGEVAVEDLRVGDRVQVVPGAGSTPPPNPLPQGEGEPLPPVPPVRPVLHSPSPCGRGLGGGVAFQPVIWLGHRTVACTRHPDPRKVWPVRVSAHAFGPGRPCRDLFLSPDHAIYVGDVLIPVKHLINDASIAQVQRNEVTYHHVELPRHSVLLAEGLPAESYLDTGDRANFANSGGSITLHPDFASHAYEAKGCAPLVGGQRTRTRCGQVLGGCHGEQRWNGARTIVRYQGAVT